MSTALGLCPIFRSSSPLSEGHSCQDLPPPQLCCASCAESAIPQSPRGQTCTTFRLSSCAPNPSVDEPSWSMRQPAGVQPCGGGGWIACCASVKQHAKCNKAPMLRLPPTRVFNANHLVRVHGPKQRGLHAPLESQCVVLRSHSLGLPTVQYPV